MQEKKEIFYIKMEQIKLSDELLKKIKFIIDREQKKDKKQVGFSQLTLWYSTQHITQGQAQQIISLYNHFDSTNENHRERKKLYDELNILPWCKNQIEHLKRIQATKRKTVQSTGQNNRTVDRLLKPSLASTRPPKAPTGADLKEGLKLKKYRVSYTANKTRYVTTLHLYSASETQAIEKLKATNYRLRGKQLIILNIVEL